jgi:putative DNA primase/helicase
MREAVATVEEFLARLKGVRRNGDRWVALCPAHADKNPSLSISVQNGKILLLCRAGCATPRVCAELGLKLSDLFLFKSDSKDGVTSNRRVETTYDYTDEKGTLLYQKVRFEPKYFQFRRPNGKGGWTWNLKLTRRVLYHLTEVLAASDVVVVEGEKDVDCARSLGVCATTGGSASDKWLQDYTKALTGKNVTVIADSDSPGRQKAQSIARALSGKAATVRLFEMPNAKDLTAWTEKGGTREVLVDLIRTAEEWKADDSGKSQTAGTGVSSVRRFVSRAVLSRVSDISPTKISWLWPGRIPLGKLTLFAGDPGLGKSFVTLDIAARITRGERWPDGQNTCEPGSVIILSAEDDGADTIRPRLEAAGARLDKIHILEAMQYEKPDGATILEHFSLEKHLATFQETAASLGDLRLVILDPISAYLGSVDSHINARVRGVLSPLIELARSLRFAAIAVDHLNKSNRQAIYRPNGSIAFAAAARAVWLFAKSPGDPLQRLMLPAKLNLAPDQSGLSYTLVEVTPELVAVKWGERTTLSADSVLAPEDAGQRSERLEAQEWLTDRLSDGPVPAGQVQKDAKDAGLAWMTVRRAKNDLGVLSTKGGFADGWYWQLPNQDVHEPRRGSGSGGGASSPMESTFGGGCRSGDPQRGASEASQQTEADTDSSVKKVIEVEL